MMIFVYNVPVLSQHVARAGILGAGQAASAKDRWKWGPQTSLQWIEPFLDLELLCKTFWALVNNVRVGLRSPGAVYLMPGKGFGLPDARKRGGDFPLTCLCHPGTRSFYCDAKSFVLVDGVFMMGAAGGVSLGLNFISWRGALRSAPGVALAFEARQHLTCCLSSLLSLGAIIPSHPWGSAPHTFGFLLPFSFFISFSVAARCSRSVKPLGTYHELLPQQLLLLFNNKKGSRRALIASPGGQGSGFGGSWRSPTKKQPRVPLDVLLCTVLSPL